MPFCDLLSSEACDAMKIAAAATETGLRLYTDILHMHKLRNKTDIFSEKLSMFENNNELSQSVNDECSMLPVPIIGLNSY